jgi:predicted dehydrogenase
MGRVHAANLATGRVSGARLVAVADSVREAAESCAAEHGVNAAYSTSDELLRDAAVAAVIIATPAETHGGLIHRAADAGKHVFRKPLGDQLERIDAASPSRGAGRRRSAFTAAST